MIEHRLYGVRVECEFPLFDRALPASAAAPGEHMPLRLVRRDEDPEAVAYSQTRALSNSHDRSILLVTDREPGRSAAGEPWCLQVRGVVSFTWAGGDSTIYYRLHEEGNRQLLVFWFVHVLVPLYLTLERGWDFMHAAAVEIGQGPALFIAPSQGGKSTLADYFLKRGHPLLSDDKVATFLQDAVYLAVPSHPHHRPYREFEVLGRPVELFAEQARPIRAFYVLERAEPGTGIEIEEVTGFRKFEELQPNYLFSFDFLRQQRLRWLGRLADSSMVFRVRRPWGLEYLGDVYEAVSEHCLGLPHSAVGLPVRP